MITKYYKLDADEALWTPGVKEAFNFAVSITGRKKPRVPFLYEETIFHDTDKEQKVYYNLLPFQKFFSTPLEDCDLVVRFCGEKNVHFEEDYDYDNAAGALHSKKFPNGFVLKPVWPASVQRRVCCLSVAPPITHVSFCCAYQKEPRKLASIAIIIHRVLEHGVPLTIPFREFHSKKEIKDKPYKQTPLKPLSQLFRRKRR
ncbi:MAG: hypothetical protein LBD40_03325 [Puniceicoccales bacterium]|jgi:hypothetical protein|nr:hypothetical protein [Puniceicoccales bacterium]